MLKSRMHGLVADLWPHIRAIQYSGHWFHEYSEDNSFLWSWLRVLYSGTITLLIVIQFAFIFLNLIHETDDVNDLAANTITVLFFTHCVTKLAYLGIRSQLFYRTLATWNVSNSHPLFAESQARHHASAVTQMRRLLVIIISVTLLSTFCWTGITFFGDSVKIIPDPDDNNETISVEIPRLMIKSWYPWDARSGLPYVISFVYQFYFLLMTMAHSNLLDMLFCCWLIYACEQLVHLKEILKPLMEISASLDTLMPQVSDVFKVASSGTHASLLHNSDTTDGNIRDIYSNTNDFSGFRPRTGTVSTIPGSVVGPNGLSKKQEILVRSAIKYWVERHKHVVKFVNNIGDAYGLALLFHMLTSTIALTLLAYQATRIDSVSVYAATVLGYLVYALGQVFFFCLYGNRLIEESGSVLESAYSVRWYDGSEEAKTFVQLVCQQCQKSLAISGAKFFTVSLDLFASVLGAVVTYFMVLIQLN